MRKVLVTGASSGIGRETAIHLSKLGYFVVLCARDEDRLKETLEMMDCSKYSHQCVLFDLTEFEKYDTIFDQIVSDKQKLYGIVHCAGIANPTPLRAMTEKSMTDIFNINYFAFMHLCRMFAKKKYQDTEQGAGSIVAVSAINSHYVNEYMSVYAASKAALETSVRTMAIEFASKNIRINTVVAGAVKSPMSDKLDDSIKNNILDKQLLGEIPAEAISQAIAFLLSDDSKYITGREMYVDGGRLGQ